MKGTISKNIKNPYLRTNLQKKQLIEKDIGTSHEVMIENALRSVITEEKWLNTAEASNYLSISEASLRNLTSSGQVPYFKLGRRNRYRKIDLDSILQKKDVTYD